MTFYEEVGGETFFADLISQFYAHVATDPVLRPMYPDSDMKGAAERLQMFLEQYWGGPSTYSEERGHPRYECVMPVFTLIVRLMMPGSMRCAKQ